MKCRGVSFFAMASIVAASFLSVVLPAGPALAGTHARVRPGQTFNGFVNGHRGIRQPVTVFVGCFGPIVPGATGHPFDGQTVTVRLTDEPGADSGATGDAATTIEAFFGAPPPAVESPASSASGSTVTFGRYGVVKPIPTAIDLPCSGNGQVTFVPFPRSPGTSRPAIVPVRYVGQP
ncbi:MAG: hypothetical protein QOH10_38 [Actinomycetota bacterium]|nr:hypothetical protein [Actinomycetota bacterium]